MELNIVYPNEIAKCHIFCLPTALYSSKTSACLTLRTDEIKLELDGATTGAWYNFVYEIRSALFHLRGYVPFLQARRISGSRFMWLRRCRSCGFAIPLFIFLWKNSKETRHELGGPNRATNDTKWATERGVGPNPGHLSRGVAQIWDMLRFAPPQAQFTWSWLSIKPCMLRFKSGNGLW